MLAKLVLIPILLSSSLMGYDDRNWTPIVLEASTGGLNAVSLTMDRVLDGDTFDVELHPFGNWSVPVRIRLQNAQAAETYRPKCSKEREIGEKATALAIKHLMVKGAEVVVTDQFGIEERGDRLLARIAVKTPDGYRDFGEILIKAGVARPWTENYEGQTKDFWCAKK